MLICYTCSVVPGQNLQGNFGSVAMRESWKHSLTLKLYCDAWSVSYTTLACFALQAEDGGKYRGASRASLHCRAWPSFARGKVQSVLLLLSAARDPVRRRRLAKTCPNRQMNSHGEYLPAHGAFLSPQV